MTRQVSQGLLENSTWERIAKIEEVAVKMWRRHSPYLTFPACAGRSWSLLKQSIFNTLLTIFSLFKFSQRYNHSGSGSQKPWRHNRSFYSLYSPPLHIHSTLFKNPINSTFKINLWLSWFMLETDSERFAYMKSTGDDTGQYF